MNAIKFYLEKLPITRLLRSITLLMLALGVQLVDALSGGLRDAETSEQWAIQRILMEGDLRESLALYPDLERIDPDRSFDQIRAAPPLTLPGCFVVRVELGDDA